MLIVKHRGIDSRQKKKKKKTNNNNNNTQRTQMESEISVLISGAPKREARVGQSPILMEYGQPLFVWLSRD